MVDLIDTNGVKPTLKKGVLGYDDYSVGGDAGRLYVGTGTASIAQAKKSEVDLKANLTNPSFTANIGLGGTTPSNWASTLWATEGANASAFITNVSNAIVSKNAYYDGAWKYKTTNPASQLLVNDGTFSFRYAPSGTLDTAITWNQGLYQDNSGNVGIGVTPSASTIPTIQSQYGMVSGNEETNVNTNAYYSSGVFKYIGNGYATSYIQQKSGGAHAWKIAPSGTAGNAITWTNAMTLDASGNLLLLSGTGVLGYGYGAGGQVIQLTSKSTAVTLNKPCGTVITSSSALAAGATVGFYMYNTLAAYSTVCVIETDSGNYNVSSITENGDVYIKLTNVTGVSLSEAIAIRFALIKGANA